MIDIKSLTREKLKEYLINEGEPAFRADQVFSWLHEKMVTSVDEMTNLPKSLRVKLAGSPVEPASITEGFSQTSPESVGGILKHEIVKVQTSRDGTKKFLLKLSDGELCECVLMEYEHGLSACLSTQIGCAMGCTFCASGMDGLVRNLSAGEIAEELYAMIRVVEKRVNNIVFMGMGEPFANYDNLIDAIKILTDEKGQNLSPRHITISTCGIVPGIMRFAKEGLPVTLALSLHAPTQEKREKIMPIATTFPLKEVIDACKYYREETGRRITYEYCLQGGVNDTEADAANLAKLLKGQDAHINLIGVHKVSGLDSKSCADPTIFKKMLEKKGINVTIRRDLGQDIDGACGQLRRKGKTV